MDHSSAPNSAPWDDRLTCDNSRVRVRGSRKRTRSDAMESTQAQSVRQRRARQREKDHEREGRRSGERQPLARKEGSQRGRSLGTDEQSGSSTDSRRTLSSSTRERGRSRMRRGPCSITSDQIERCPTVQERKKFDSRKLPPHFYAFSCTSNDLKGDRCLDQKIIQVSCSATWILGEYRN